VESLRTDIEAGLITPDAAVRDYGVLAQRMLNDDDTDVSAK